MTNETTARQPKDLSASIQHAMYQVAQRGESVERMHTAVMAVIDSQPKSIGDDVKEAQRDLMHITAFLGEKQAPQTMINRLKSVMEFVSRAPAAQASATIQVAPEGYAIVPIKPTPEMCAKGFCVSEAEHDPAGVYAAMLDARLAATIQEPVMVAEPVGEVVLFGGDLKEVSWAKGKMPAPGTKLYAAPMVADPAGVAGLELSDEGIVKVLASFGIDSTESKYGFDALQVATTVPSIRKVVETYLAATVKAVPSEAVGEVRTDIERVSVIWYGNKPAHGTVLFAAPLADKTGGGE